MKGCPRPPAFKPILYVPPPPRLLPPNWVLNPTEEGVGIKKKLLFGKRTAFCWILCQERSFSSSGQILLKQRWQMTHNAHLSQVKVWCVFMYVCIQQYLLFQSSLCEVILWTVDSYSREYAKTLSDGSPIIGITIAKYAWWNFFYTSMPFAAMSK